MQDAGIYAIVNLINGKRYIGSSTNIAQRWHNHRSKLSRKVHPSPVLQSAWDKYGEGAFEFVVIEFVDDHSLLFVREQHYMDLYKSEYNIRTVAHSNAGMKYGPRSPEHTRKIVEAQKGKTSPARKAAAERRRGIPSNPESVKKMRATKKANPTRYWEGKKRSPEDIEKFRKSHLGQKLSPESIAKREATKRANRLAKRQKNQPELPLEP